MPKRPLNVAKQTVVYHSVLADGLPSVVVTETAVGDSSQNFVHVQVEIAARDSWQLVETFGPSMVLRNVTMHSKHRS